MTAERDRIVADHGGIPWHFARKYGRGDWHRTEELRQDASLALVRAAARLAADPSLAADYGAHRYLCLAVNRDLIDGMRSESGRGRRPARDDGFDLGSVPADDGSVRAVDAADLVGFGLSRVAPHYADAVASAYGLSGRRPVSAREHAARWGLGLAAAYSRRLTARRRFAEAVGGAA